MPRPLPKRLHELSPIKSDSDDELNVISSHITVGNDHQRLQPKRLSELEINDSCSEDDDNKFNITNDHSSGFNESVIDSVPNSSTPLGKENQINYCNTSPVPPNDEKFVKPLANKETLQQTDKETIPNAVHQLKANYKINGKSNCSESQLELNRNIRRTLEFSPLDTKLTSKNNIENNMLTPQTVLDDLFVTPSIKQPLTTGRIIFSSSQNKHRKPVKVNQKILFATPQQPINNQRIITSNTSDYVTDSCNSFKMTTILSPIDEEKLTIDEFLSINSKCSADNSSSICDKVLEINRKDFVLKKKIGSGGSSTVLLAQNKMTGKDCAVKVVQLHGEESIVQGYLSEANLLKKLQGKDCVIQLFECSHIPDKHTLFMVMELGETDLSKILKSYKSAVPLSKIITFWHQMLQAVKYIHINGIIHSDLKPANFLMVNGRLKLIDFGIASDLSTDSTSIIKSSQTGTINYISPEALIDTSTGNTPVKKVKYKISTKSDVWSLGCIFYLCVYGQTPFTHIKNMYAKFAAITNKSTEINYPSLPIYYPPMLLEIIQNCLRFDPKERYTIDELLQYPFNMIDESIS